MAGRVARTVYDGHLCMNQGLDCGTTVPYAYSKAENTGK